MYTNLPVGEVIEVSDWKMKFIMLLFRETMPDFFGKSGNPWVGTMFIVKVKPGDELLCFYYDGFMNDKKEDAFAALSFLEAVQGHFYTEVYPTLFTDADVTMPEAIFYTVFLDGAGCYVAAENLLTRLAFSSRINVYMKAMYIPEAYFNKTPLDGHFAVAGKQMRAAVASGNFDAFDASSMFKARVADLAKGEGAKNFVLHFEPNRDQQCHVKDAALRNIKKISARIPVWIKNNRENRIEQRRLLMKAKYKRMICTQLKAKLQDLNLPKSGRKSELVQRLLDATFRREDDVNDGGQPALHYLLQGVRLHRHSGMGTGQYYSLTDILAMWKKEPQVRTGVQIVEQPTAAGGTSHSTSMGGSKKATKVTRSDHSRTTAKNRGTMKQMKAKRLSDKHRAVQQENDKIRSLSNGFWCRLHGGHPECNRFFKQRADLEKHLRKQECQSGTQFFRKSSKKVGLFNFLDSFHHLSFVLRNF